MYTQQHNHQGVAVHIKCVLASWQVPKTNVIVELLI